MFLERIHGMKKTSQEMDWQTPSSMFNSTPLYLFVCLGLLIHILLHLFYKFLQLSHKLQVTAGQLLRGALKHIPHWSKCPGTREERQEQLKDEDGAKHSHEHEVIPHLSTESCLHLPELRKITSWLGKFGHRPGICLLNSAPETEQKSNTHADNRINHLNWSSTQVQTISSQ